MLADLSLVQSFNHGTDGFCHLTLHPLIKDCIRVRIKLSTRQKNAATAGFLLRQSISKISVKGQHLHSFPNKQALLSHFLVEEENHCGFLSRSWLLPVEEEVDRRILNQLEWCQDFMAAVGQCVFSRSPTAASSFAPESELRTRAS